MKIRKSFITLFNIFYYLSLMHLITSSFSPVSCAALFALTFVYLVLNSIKRKNSEEKEGKNYGAFKN